MNAIKTTSGTEIYLNELYALADQYEAENGTPEPENIAKLLLFIADRIEKPEHDPELLDKLFDAYIRLCVNYNALPTLQGFGLLVGINSNTFSAWRLGEYGDKKRLLTSPDSLTLQKCVTRWKAVCGDLLIQGMVNEKGASINRIFIAKAVYGLAETSPQPSEVVQERRYLSGKDLKKLPG